MDPVVASHAGDDPKLGIAVFAAAVVATDANAFHTIRRVDQSWHDPSRRYPFLNADVNRHYRNEVTFAGRYLGADPDPAIRLNLRIDRPDGR
jgi:hypothetical protein